MRLRSLSAFAVLVCLAAGLAGQEPLTLVRYGQDMPLRDRLIREVAVYADLGGSVVARVSPAVCARLREAGTPTFPMDEPQAHEQVAAFYLRFPLEQPQGVRILLTEANRHLVAGTPDAIQALRRPGLVHGGIDPIGLDARYLPVRAPDIRLPLAPDPKIAALVAKVDKNNLVAHITQLSNIHTRNATQPQNATALQYVQNELQKLPRITFKTESFNTRYGPNLIAEVKGYETPDQIVMIGAHIDSYVFNGATARSPGADDNASGSASVLEIARILANAPLQYTVRFGWWNAEEYGLIGSAAYAAAASTRGDKILAYINADMNAYRDPTDTVDVDFILNDSTTSLVNALVQISQTYVPTLGTKTASFSGGTSDHRSFFRNGYAAAFPFEDGDKYSPYIHSGNDDMVNSTNDMNLSFLITQSMLAGVATYALPLAEPSYQLNVTAGPSVGGTQVTATGSYLSATESVKVAGIGVPFQVGAGSVQFETPTVDVLGPVTVEIANPAGGTKASFTYQKTAPPALRIPASLKPSDKGALAIGGEPGHIAVALFSGIQGSTNLGLLTVDIGGGNPLQIFFFAAGVLRAGGGTLEIPFAIPGDPKLSGVVAHFQAAILEPTLASTDKTNVGTLKIQ